MLSLQCSNDYVLFRFCLLTSGQCQILYGEIMKSLITKELIKLELNSNDTDQ